MDFGLHVGSYRAQKKKKGAELGFFGRTELGLVL